MGKYFGTDGVRGKANDVLTCDLAYKLGRYGSYVLSQGKKDTKIVIGRDTRLSGDMLESALIAGIMSVGCDAICVGVLPTPAVAYLTRKYNAAAGIVISASHNPFEDNGIKFFSNDGYKLPDEVENDIESYIDGKKLIEDDFTCDKVGKIITVDHGYREYNEFIKNTIEGDLTGMKVALDCSNGAAFEAAPELFEELGATVKVINHNPNGVNINYKCGSTHPEGLQDLVRAGGFDIGLAFDGDADRLIAVDENGDLVDGDKIMVVSALHLKEHGKLNNNTLVATVMSNMGLIKALESEGIEVIKTAVGDRYVLEEMKKGGHSIGGEQSGHLIFLDHNTTGDGMLSGLQLLSVLKEKDKPLSELASVMTTYPQVLKNALVDGDKKHKYKEDSVIMEKIHEIEEIFHGEGRVLIRPSGTENKVRVMIEGKDENMLNKYATEMVELIESRLKSN